MMDFFTGTGGTYLTAAILVLACVISGTAAEDCELFSCPNFATRAYSALTDTGSLSYCCHHKAVPVCCDWKDRFATFVGLDPDSLGIPVGAIIGIVIGGFVLALLFLICCCFCCGCCCFRGRKRTITQHSTVAYGKAGNA